MARNDLSAPSKPLHRTWEVVSGVAVVGIVAVLIFAPKSAWPAVILLAIVAIASAAMSVLTTRRGRRALLDVGDQPVVTSAHGTSRRPRSR